MSKIIYPLTAPELPVPGGEFLRTAADRGDDSTKTIGVGRKAKVVVASPVLEELVEECLYGGGTAEITYKLGPSKSSTVTVVSGHVIGREGPSAGPEPADVMVIGKMLGPAERNLRRCLVEKSPLGEFFIEALLEAGIPREFINTWYMTNVLKSVEPEAGKWRASWTKGSDHLLKQELRLVRPKFILCLGTIALKALYGTRATLSRCEGQIMDYRFCVSKEHEEELEYHDCKVMGVMHPRAVMKEPELLERYTLSLSRFYRLTQGSVSAGMETAVDHRVIDNEGDLAKLAKEIEENCPSKLIAVDAEWHGEHPQNSGSYLRCIQVSWADRKAACIVLSHAGGKPAFKRYLKTHSGEAVETTQGGTAVAINMLNDLLKDKRIVGHYFTADLEWLVHYGLDLREQYKPADTAELCKTQGGLDTALMAHALNEIDDFSLNGQIFRYLDINRYDTELMAWKDEYCSANGLRSSDLEGYGDCPGDILYPYANFDADATRRLAVILMDKLDSDRYGNNCWKPFWVTHSASLPILEMKTTGLLIDRNRLDELTVLYMQAEQRWGREIREWAKWDGLNMNSVFNMRELLFGAKYNGKKDSSGRPVRLRPQTARSLNAVPVLSVGKRARPWSEIVRDGLADDTSVSTNKQVLGIMYHNAKKTKVRVPDGRGNWVVVEVDYSDIISAIRNYKIVSHVFKSLLDKPKLDLVHDCYETDDDSNWVYDRGIAKYICSDGRVRTTIYPTKETGRWSSARPAMQNWSKKREADYEDILGDDYKYPLRSMIVADPGHVLVEADYIGAELFIMAVLSGDPVMLDHVQRNQLPEDDPNYHDIHSSIAKLAFNLPCEPTKAGLGSIGKKHLRIVAKAVAFGVAYGRQAKAIAVAVQEEGITITEEEAQAIIQAIFAMYPALETFFKECRDRVNTPTASFGKPAPGWLANSFNRYRRFSTPEDDKALGEMERQSMNYPLQSTVADAVSLATKNFYEYRQAHKDEVDYRLVLQVHDAIMLLVPIKHVKKVITEVIPQCMVHKVPIFRTNLDGQIIDKDPYFLGTDTNIYKSWGVTMLPNELLENGISPELDGWNKVGPGWGHSDFGTDVWVDGKFYKLEELELVS